MLQQFCTAAPVYKADSVILHENIFIQKIEFLCLWFEGFYKFLYVFVICHLFNYGNFI